MHLILSQVLWYTHLTGTGMYYHYILLYSQLNVRDY